MRLITDGKYDVMKVSQIDTKGGWLYFYASPENATQMYLWRVRLTGGTPERLTPATEPGTHDYDIGPGAKFAIHTRSSWGAPPVVDLVRLPTHETARVLADNRALKEKLDGLRKQPIEFTQVDVGGGVKLDAWVMRPADFDSTKKYPVLFYVYGEPWARPLSTTTAAAATCGISCSRSRDTSSPASTTAARRAQRPRLAEGVAQSDRRAACARPVGGGKVHRTSAVR
jgi:dipeptidyl-peptidase-4